MLLLKFWNENLLPGICRYSPREGHCSIGMSTPLLKLRPRKDMVETLLHEMIHAYLFVTQVRTNASITNQFAYWHPEQPGQGRAWA